MVSPPLPDLLPGIQILEATVGRCRKRRSEVFLWRYRALSDVRAFPLLAALHGGSHPQERGPHHSNIISLIEISIGLTPRECGAVGLLPGTGLVFPLHLPVTGPELT
ncbi:MAG: hypothetical protein WCA42_02450 [Desulfobacterales bacterium]